jgi:pyruvate carboxylase
MRILSQDLGQDLGRASDPRRTRRRTVQHARTKVGEELAVDIEPGKTLVIRLLSVGEPHTDGTRTVYAERDGKLAEVLVAPGTPVEAGELVVRYES